MSEINNDADLGDIEAPIELPKEGDTDYDKTDWKAIADKNRGIAQRNFTRAQKAKEKAATDKKPDADAAKPKDGAIELDRTDKLALRSAGITDVDEVKLVMDLMKETGKDVDSLIDSKYFQAELKGLRDERAADDASSSSKRSGASAKDSVEYWLAKGGLPEGNPELSRKVVNARIAKEKSGSKFSKNPVL